MIEGLVSTVIPVHNRPAMLREAVASVLAQTYRPVEIIIVDDGSTDSTAAVADELAGTHQEISHVLHQPNGGPGAAREAGRRVARGEFIQYLDSDDLLLPRKFELQVAALRSHPTAQVAYGRTSYRGAGGETINCIWKPLLSGARRMFPLFLVSRAWETATPLYRSDLLDRTGPWLSTYLEEDWEYDCRVAAEQPDLVFIDEIVAEHRAGASGRLSQSQGAGLDRRRISDRAIAHTRVFDHAIRGGVAIASPQMQHYARELFLLARQCGAAGLTAESKRLFELARRASGESRAAGYDFRLYKLLSSMIGWRAAGKLACLSDGLRR